MKITKTMIEKLVPADGKPKYLWEENTPGFGVKVTAAGKKSFIFKYRIGQGRKAKQRWMTLGNVRAVRIESARNSAREAYLVALSGRDPKEVNVKPKVTRLSEVWERYSQEKLPRLKTSTQNDYSSMWAISIAPKLGGHDVSKISRADIAGIHEGLSKTPYRANRVLALISSLLNHAETWEYRTIGANPCQRIKKYTETPKERFLSLDEVNTLFSVMREMVHLNELESSLDRYFRLMLFTGARKNEILQAKLAWVDSKNLSLELPDSKTGKRSIPLSVSAMKILVEQMSYANSRNSEYLFPGRDSLKPKVNVNKAWSRIRKKACLNNLRIHDLRHTSASLMAEDGTPLMAIGKVLGHSNARTTERYAHIGEKVASKAAESLGKRLGGM